VAGVLLAAASCSGDDGDAAERSPDDPAATSTTDAPRFSGSPDSPFCTLLREADIDGAIQGEPGAPDTIRAGFEQLVRTLDQAAEAAPDEIAADAAALADGIAALRDALAAAGYDYDQLALSPEAREVTQAVNDPAFTVAGDRLRAYREQVCDL
jgi:hypothetical protein